MKVGIKFCGHCAPRRDMALFAEELKRLLPDTMFVYQSQDPATDALLVLCACQSACASIPGDYENPVILVTPFAVNNVSTEDPVCEVKRRLVICQV